ncbi:MAG: histidine ammonia-lyase [Armatimonadetes bacterium]|nr:histidine ammonia-lyase [Armatimonadota bacterium]
MIELSGEPLSLEAIARVARGREEVALSASAIKAMKESRAVVEGIVHTGEPVYGVNTGFGRLANVRIPDEDLGRLQLNLVRSHACGVMEPLSEPETRALMLLRANVLAKGYSGARPDIAQILVDSLNEGVYPVVPSRGSVGASGDLAPLAHLALVLVGEGEAFVNGRRVPGREALFSAGLLPIGLEAKEGLALLNGTQAMMAVGALATLEAIKLAESADLAGAMTLEALRDTPAAFDPRIQGARPHAGQAAAAKHLRELLEDSEIRESHREGDTRVQDAYSLRCMPQVHGAVRDAMAHVRSVLEIESGSGTDNPLVFAETGEVVSGGNFHGAPIAYVMDYAAIAITDLASISERRIERLVNPDLSEGLPSFLTDDAGVQSGFMMAQVTAAALLAECRVLSHPSSIDNVPTSGGKEDHVSMGMTAALKFRKVVDCATRVLAIEFLCAAQGLEYRKPLKPGVGVQDAFEELRRLVSKLEEDRPLGPDIEKIAGWLATRF